MASKTKFALSDLESEPEMEEVREHGIEAIGAVIMSGYYPGENLASWHVKVRYLIIVRACAATRMSARYRLEKERLLDDC